MIRKTIFFGMIVSLLVSCGTEIEGSEASSNGADEIADYTEVPPLGMEGDHQVLIDIDGNKEEFIQYSSGGHQFMAVVNADLDTTRIVCHDSTFITPEGYRVGTYWIDIPLAEQTEVRKKDGYGYYLKLYSGWTLGFCEGDNCADGELEKMSRVAWIEK